MVVNFLTLEADQKAFLLLLVLRMHQTMHKMKVLDNNALLDGTLVLMNQFFCYCFMLLTVCASLSIISDNTVSHM